MEEKDMEEEEKDMEEEKKDMEERRRIWKRRIWRRRRWDLNLNKRRVPGGILSGTVGTRATWEITSFCSEYLTQWSAVYVVDWLKFIQVHLSFDC